MTRYTLIRRRLRLRWSWGPFRFYTGTWRKEDV